MCKETSNQFRENPDSVRAMPIRQNERIQVIDVLRGFALFGVIVVNMSVDTVWSEGHVLKTPPNWDNWIFYFLRFFAAGKFITLFTFLFGLGFFMQIERFKKMELPFCKILTRRMGILLVFGLIHYLLIGWTDILHAYAILGIVLLLFHAASARLLLISALAIAILNTGDPNPVVLHGLNQVFMPVNQDVIFEEIEPKTIDNKESFTTAQEGIYATGSYHEILRVNWDDFSRYIRYFALRWWLGSLLPVMLLGGYVAKKGILRNNHISESLLKKIVYWGLLIGLPCSIFTLLGETILDEVHISGWILHIKSLTDIVGIRAIGFTYGAVIVLLYQRINWNRLLKPFSSVGRTALTNYLMQTAIAVILFYRVGFGMYGKLSPVVGAMVAIFIFVAQIVVSRFWMKRFRFGPFEWLWRSLTYGKWQKLNIKK